MYASSVWAGSLDTEANRSILRRAQKTALTKTTNTCRTVTYLALCVLTGRMPLHIKARMWRAVFTARATDRANPDLRRNPAIVVERGAVYRKRALAEAMKEWQVLWDGFDPSNWSRRLVGPVSTFVGKHGLRFSLDY